MTHYCAYHQAEHPDSDFGKRSSGKLDSWCRAAKAETKRDPSQPSRVLTKSPQAPQTGRPRWYTPEQFEDIKSSIAQGQSYSEIGRRYDRQASQILLIAKREGWKQPEKEIPKTKICTGCNKEFLVEEFPFRTDRPRTRRAKCEPCHRQWSNESNRRLYNPAHARQRRVRMNNAPGWHTAEQWEARIEYFGGRCYLCGCDWRALPKGEQTMEHVKCLYDGGSHWASNLRPACASCNSQKWKRDWRPYVHTKRPA